MHVNRNVYVRGGGYYHDYDDGIGAGGAIAIGVAGMAIVSMITAAALPLSCSTVSVNGMTYQQHGRTWYQPQYSGSQVNYIVHEKGNNTAYILLFFCDNCCYLAIDNIKSLHPLGKYELG